MFRTLLFQIVRRRWFFVALALGAGVILLPRPEGLSSAGQCTLGILTFAITCFLTEPIPLPAVALLIGVGEVVFGIKSAQEMPKSYMSGAVFFIMGSLMIGASLVQLRLDRRIALLLIKITGTRFFAVITGLSLTAAILASLVGPHVITATLMPVALALAFNSNAKAADKRRMACAMLIALAYAAAIGGAGTPSGSARNAIMIEYLRHFLSESSQYMIDNPEYFAQFANLKNYHMEYGHWVLTAFPLVLVSVPVVVLICIWTFKPQIRDLSPAVTVLKEEASKDRNPGQAIVASAIILLILVLFLTQGNKLGIGTIAVLGASLFLITGLVRWDQINKSVNWGVFLLYAAAISLGISMDETGAARWLAEDVFGSILPEYFLTGLPFLFAVTLLITLATNIMSGGPAVAVIGPIVLVMAAVNKQNIVMAGIMVAAASSFSYLTVMSNPANSIVYASGQVKSPDFLKAGWKMSILSTILIMLLAWLYWPLVIRS